ncbi:hypothetical protein HDV05_001530 [Chytridiales sp. JEL 0842]|nr:hypothetical protein HDV05_001530 [Chytridiales sp. JEL 0842]
MTSPTNPPEKRIKLDLSESTNTPSTATLDVHSVSEDIQLNHEKSSIKAEADVLMTDRTTLNEPTTTSMINSEGREQPTAAPKKISPADVAASLTASMFGSKQGRNYLIEEDVGILGFLQGDLPGFTGVIKDRYSDFLVNEVDFTGKILHLELPEPANASSTEEPITEAQQKASEAEQLEEMEKVFKDDADFIAKLKALVETPEDKRAEVGEIVTKPIAEKDERTNVHRFIKKYYRNTIISSVNPDQSISIRFKNDKEKTNATRPRRSNVDWNELGGEYLEFVLYKENRDTMDVLSHIARISKTSSKAFTFAGTKDKRGVTVQRMTGHKVTKEVLEFTNGKVYGSQVGNFRYTKDRVTLGDLAGNHFCITLRNVQLIDATTSPDSLEDIINQSMTSLKENGFINYYGMQRFGTRAISTHAVGVAMLAGRWDVAVDLVLMPKGQEKADFMRARQHWMEHRDARECLNIFPRNCVAERAILNYFVRNKNTTENLQALQSIPRNLRLMYVHAVQSYIWNHMASERIRIYGFHKIVKGDLVALPNALSSSNIDILSDPSEDIIEGENGGSVEEARLGRMIEVKLIETDEEAEKWGIEDLVLPLPGYAVQYPTNEIGQGYVDFMAQYGLDPHDMRRKHRETSLAGDYRRVIAKPKNVAWKCLRYNDPTAPLTLTDMDKINRVPEPQSIPDGQRLALVCEFTLEPASYATMALREVLKSDTSSGSQGELSRKTA